MGVLYFPHPLTDEQFADEECATWLAESGIKPPPSGQQGRWPTMAEWRQTLDAIDNHDIQYSVGEFQPGHLSIIVEIRSLEDYPNGLVSPIRISDYDGDENKIVQFYFEKGAPEAHLVVLKYLARLCGPYSLYGDDAAVPVLIDAETNLDEINRWWYSERERIFDERVSAEANDRQDCR